MQGDEGHQGNDLAINVPTRQAGHANYLVLLLAFHAILWHFLHDLAFHAILWHFLHDLTMLCP